MIWLAALISLQTTAQPLKKMAKLWQYPTREYQMKTWWFFGYEKTSEEGITADVEALRDAGFGGVVYYDQNHAKDAEANGADPGWSEAWWRHLKYAAKEARRVGLDFELNISNGYCAGGTWIDPSHAMQRVAYAEAIAEKGPDGVWRHKSGSLSIEGRDGYVKDIALVIVPCHDDGKMRHFTAQYIAQGKGRNGAMQGPVEEKRHGHTHTPDDPDPYKEATEERFTGYGFTPLPDIGMLQASDDSLYWRDVVRIRPMYRSQGGYFTRTTAFPATEGRFWRIKYFGKELIKNWHVGGEAKMDRWEERAALHSDFAEGDLTPPYPSDIVIDPCRMSIIHPPYTLSIEHLPFDSTATRCRIIRLAAVLTGAKTKHGRPDLLGYECDKLSSDAAKRHWEHYVQVILDSLPAGMISGITMDSHEGGSQNWTPRMLEKFRSLRGYDFTPYLPVLAGYIVESVERTRQVLFDYRQTIADCMREEYFGTFQQLATARGLTFTAQAIGNALCITGDAVSVKRVVEKPQGEFWTYQKDGAYDVKDCSSAAHLYAKPVASAEAMTDCEYKDQPADLHRVANIAFSMGAQEFVVCATPHIPQVKPSGPYVAGREYAINRSNPLWKDFMPVWRQAARSMVLLRQGKAAPDVLVYLGDDVPIKTIASRLPPGLDQLDWDVCTGDALRTRIKAERGVMRTPDGVSYRALLIADQAFISEPTQEVMDGLHAAGVPVLRSGESISRLLNIESGRESVVHTHRSVGEEQLFYVANIKDCATELRFSLSDQPRRISVWHNMTGRRQSLQAGPGGTFTLRLAPSESVFIIYTP